MQSVIDSYEKLIATERGKGKTRLDRLNWRPHARRPYRGGPPMTLANMHENGVRSLPVTCEPRHHEAVMNVDARYDDRVRAVPISV
jgi:hypothetical protein